MSQNKGLSRRSLMKSAAGIAGASLVGRAAYAAAPLTVGFIYVGTKTDYGYNQAHAEGAAAVRAMPGVTVVEQSMVPESVAVQNAMSSMIQLDGASLLFPTSFGYFDPYVVEEARQNASTSFMHCGGLWKNGDPLNAHTYMGYIDEAMYISGIVAAHMTKTKKFGFVGAKPIPQVLRNINAFTLGAQSVDPSITTQVIFTGDWSLPVREAEATNSLADQGADVISCHVDSPIVIMKTAEQRGLFTCGYHVNQAPLAPKGYLTGAEWNWSSLYPRFVQEYIDHQQIPNRIRGGFKSGFVRNSPYNAIVPASVRAEADAARAKFITGNFEIFKGPMKDNKGNTVIAAGTTIDAHDPSLEEMNYLVAGISGTTA
jgi:basic membrane protein A and related proteins